MIPAKRRLIEKKYQSKTRRLFIVEEGMLMTYYSSRPTNTRYSQAFSIMGSSEII